MDESKDVQNISVVGAKDNHDISLDESKDDQNISVVGAKDNQDISLDESKDDIAAVPVSYTHLRAHET